MFGGGKGDKGKELKLKADKAYAEQKWNKALGLYREAAEHHKDDARLLQRIGDLCRRMKMNEEAVEEYKNVAAIYAKAGFWAKAIAINKIILEIDPTDVTVQRKLAEMYSTQSTKAQTLPAGATIAGAPPVREEPAAISLVGEEPRTMEEPPHAAGVDLVIGGTVSIAKAEPRTLDDKPEVPSEAGTLGRPLDRLSNVPLLSEMSPEELYAVLERLTVRRYPPGAYVCEEGDIGRSMYIIAEGEVAVSVRDRDGSRLVLGHLRGGDFFGEFGLMTNGERNATVQARTELELLEITASDLDAIASRHPRVWEVLEEYLRHRVIDTILRKSDVFRALADGERVELTKCLTPRKVRMHEIVMAEGTPGEEMYFVKSGSLVVSSGEGHGRAVLGEVGPGDYFGDVAMLTGKSRTATVLAKTDCELYQLARRDAARVFRANREILTRLKQKIETRTRENLEIYRSLEEARKTLEFV